MNLFEQANEQIIYNSRPLAVRMRPESLPEFVGQEIITGKGGFLSEAIARDNLPSILFFGPPGSGKTTLAQIIANKTGSYFAKANATLTGTAEIRKIMAAATERLGLYGQKTILFIDEIHRFNKAQQDVLLSAVENGTLTLIGATTENPYFEINSPLLSRMHVIRLQPLSAAALQEILRRALKDTKRGLGKYQCECSEPVMQAIIQLAGGDARVGLNILEQAVIMAGAAGGKEVTLAIVTSVTGRKMIGYDKRGDNHYDTISAFIKSLRGSDPDAALHYLAKMLEAGEDIKFIARRIVICAAEDVGNADPLALVMATSAAQGVQMVGLPEARIILAQAVTYIASAPKSNAAYLGIEKAIQDVQQMNCGQVPPHLRDSSYRGAEKLGHGLDYRYPHDYEQGFVKQSYLPAELAGKKYYRPKDIGRERYLSQRLQQLWGSRDSND